MTAITAAVAFTVEFQPLIVPSRVAKMKEAAPDTPFCVTTKPEVVLAAIPVGLPFPVEPVGTVTTNGTIVPLASYTVDNPVNSSEIQKAPPGR